MLISVMLYAPMLIIVMLSLIVSNVVMLSVVTKNVVAPFLVVQRHFNDNPFNISGNAGLHYNPYQVKSGRVGQEG